MMVGFNRASRRGGRGSEVFKIDRRRSRLLSRQCRSRPAGHWAHTRSEAEAASLASLSLYRLHAVYDRLAGHARLCGINRQPHP